MRDPRFKERKNLQYRASYTCLQPTPPQTLRDRLKGHPSRAELRNHNHRLSGRQEEALIGWIVSLDIRGAPPRHFQVREMAQIILDAESSTPSRPIGKNWVTEFTKRRPEVKTRFARKINRQRALCEDPKVIGQWFSEVQKVKDQWGIQDEDIYNFDETGFAMGLIATTKVVSRAEMPGKPWLIQPGNREWVTTIECVNSRGWSVPSTIIFKGKVHIEGWFDEAGIPHEWRIELSPNGWTSDIIGLRWLQKVFIPATNRRTRGGYRLLVLDGHGSHLTPEFDQTCKENNIIPICMPAHSSHLLQPLDVGCFAPLKRVYGKLIEQKGRLGYNHIDKLDFLKAYPAAHQEVFTIENTQSGFRASGLIPFNPRAVLDKLNLNLGTPTPPPSRGGASIPSSQLGTPYTVRHVHRKGSSVRKLLQKRSKSPLTPTKKALDELVKGCELAIYNAGLLARENCDLRSAIENDRQKKSRSKRQMTPTTGLSIQEGRDLILLRNELLNKEEGGTGTSAPETLDRPKRAPPTCSECNIQGHTRVRCPNRYNV